MTDNLALTIAALRDWRESTARNLCWWNKVAPGSITPDDIYAICDAAEAGLRCPPRNNVCFRFGTEAECRDPTQCTRPECPPREPHPCYKTGLLCHCETIADCLYAKPINEGGPDAHPVGGNMGNPDTRASVPPSPDAALVERLRWEASNRGLPPFDGWGWLSKAAATITRLTAELAEARAECERLRALLDRVSEAWITDADPDELPELSAECRAAIDAERKG